VRGRKNRMPARFMTFDTAIYPECNPQSGAATLRGRAPLERRPRFNKCALMGVDSSPKETGVLGRFPGSGFRSTSLFKLENPNPTRLVQKPNWTRLRGKSENVYSGTRTLCLIDRGKTGKSVYWSTHYHFCP
jgi:hypothetical protein